MTREEREEALDVLTDMANALHLIPTTRQGKVFKMILQELQKPEPDVLDKIRSEVLEYIDDLDIAAEICDIFDKYKSESEG